MNILLIGSGGREHALAWKIAQSPKTEQLFIAPGNAGTAQVGTNIAIGANDFKALSEFSLREKVTMIIVGPEEPLVNGIVDYFAEKPELEHIAVIGPSQKGAQLEGSKDFAKQFMLRHGIPTAAYRSYQIDQQALACSYIDRTKPPYVLKADGLAAGKGVLILNSAEEAKEAVRYTFFGGKFGRAGSKIVIEQFLSGIELSVFVLTDGRDYLILPEAKDYKRVGEGDTGLNTGGMGAVSPVPFADAEFMQKVESRIVRPTIEGLRKEDITYKGFIFFGLINVDGEPMVIEYNVRMGDPETEVVIPRIESDIVELFEAVAAERIGQCSLSIVPQTATTVMLTSGGYPEDYKKGKTIEGLDRVGSDCTVFHAGTAMKNGQVVTSGGRVMAVTALGASMDEALAVSNRNAELIRFDGCYHRRDIGFDLKKR